MSDLPEADAVQWAAGRSYSPETFQRWLNQVKAEAWSEGMAAGLDAGLKVGEVLLMTANIADLPKAPSNPYREADSLPIHRTEAGWPNCATCDGVGCHDCTGSAL